MNSKQARQIPVKWLVVIVFALIAYGLGQPVANRKLGWKLPSLASLLGNEDSTKANEKQEKAVSSETAQRSPAKDSGTDSDTDLDFSPSADDNRPATPEPSSEKKISQKADNAEGQSGPPASKLGEKSTNSSPATKPPASTKTAGSTKPPAEQEEELLYGLLKETGREDYISPAGLRFTRGSEEGHRLKHLARHLEDQPDRPGKHGVFNGDMPVVLKLLDEAYQRASSGAKGTSKRDEDGRTVYEVNFSKPIGYVGGRDGARQKNPDSKRLRMVVDGNRLITAFPF